MRRVAVVLGAVLTLAACGGGGSGDAAGTEPTTTECTETDTRTGTTTEPDPRCPGAPSQATPNPHPELGDVGAIWTGTSESAIKVRYCEATTGSGELILGVFDDGKVNGTWDARVQGYSCTPPGGPYSVSTRTNRLEISGRKTATAFDLRFGGGSGRLIVRGNEAKNTFTQDTGGSTARTTIVVRCTWGACP